MKTWKIVAGVAAIAAVAGAGYASVKWNQKGIVTVQTGKAARQDLTSIVTASGEIKPRNYINIGSNANGAARITDILVVEGARVRKGQLLAKLESVQPEAEVAAQRATVTSSEAESSAAEAALKAQDSNIRTLQAGLDRVKADLARAKADEVAARREAQLARLVAPFDGIVTRMTAVLGASVDPSQPVVEVADPRALDIVRATRPKSDTSPENVKKWVAFGGSVRAAQYLVLGAKARALTSGRYHVSFDDIRAIAHPVLRHRIITNFHAQSEGVTTDQITDRILELVPTPRSGM